jgi:hypothetical protein
MADAQRTLRTTAREVLEKRGYSDVESLKGSGGARLIASEKGEPTRIMVRTSSDRWVGWMRSLDGDLKGLDDADLVVVAALDTPIKPREVEVYAFDPAEIRDAFQANLDARSAKGLGDTAPIFVCLDKSDSDKPSAVSSDLKVKALWSQVVPLGESKPVDEEINEAKDRAEDAADAMGKPDADYGKMDVEGFLLSVKAELAARLNVPAKSLSLELRLQV